MRKKTIELYNNINSILLNAGVIAPAFESFMILKTVFNKNYIDIQDDDITEDKIKKIEKILDKRKKRYPLQYILSRWEFWNLEFMVAEGVLIPRGDTECLVETGLSILKGIKDPVIIDICSGSGCIAISLAKEIPGAKIFALEKSEKAYEYLLKNISLNQVSGVRPILGDLREEAINFRSEYFDLIVSNPPYIKTSEINGLQEEVKFEPKMALDGGNDGLYFYREIIRLWKDKLKKTGSLAFEIGKDQDESVMDIMKEAGLIKINSYKDLGKINRVISGQRRE